MLGSLIVTSALAVLCAVLWFAWHRQARFTQKLRDAFDRLPLAAGCCPRPGHYEYLTPVIVMAHRGLAQYATENTGPAIQLAALAGLNGVEVDVRFTNDNVPVLHHDSSLRRLAMCPRRIRDLSWSQLADIAVMPANRVLSLDAFLASFGGSFDRVMLDLKDFRDGSEDEEQLNVIVRCLTSHDVLDQVLVDSASLDCVRYLQKEGVTASWREPALPSEKILALGVRHVSMAHAPAKAFYGDCGWSDLAVTVICPPTPDEDLWFIEHSAYAVITDRGEETLDLMAQRGHVVARPGPHGSPEN